MPKQSAVISGDYDLAIEDSKVWIMLTTKIAAAYYAKRL